LNPQHWRQEWGGSFMAMTLVFGTVEGLGYAERFAVTYFGPDGFRRASQAEVTAPSRQAHHPRGRMARFLSGELEPKLFDGHVVAVDGEAEYEDEVLCFEVGRDGVVETFAQSGLKDHYILGVRTLSRWIELPKELGRELIEVWVDLDESERPVVGDTHPEAYVEPTRPA
jgi:hypothetical protein